MLSTMVGENLKCTQVKWIQIIVACPPYVIHHGWRKFEMYSSEMDTNHCSMPTICYPPWLEKI